ncbi:PTS sugar transporter subunit IIA [Lacticaseibacillus zeae]|uniref:PTS fructose transporter subunit IIA n=1 Tax=Lacticaseibacillus zeae subsp. silagei TaxID=3068307 RepID=A0ABD7ZAT7_LACZE|nr:MULTISPECIES: PTS fructose transporter subunit IIA [Lacticaseibacillus]MDE3314412.1 PTS fructose transporter subunit IIA [Lacticaseibacillus zeae]OFR98948.1 PTS fructose transporter subunit IIA [Lactobacillus sp. HMSC068F07]WLV84043.1 PTS fructose transporter subunit IIA [Lacticaseibacillus sp. NCIMB 15475]WLV86799.1 PTS fructose transporter subunit IIA [Lacticaseibacillus sp. NCIMB 15474]
MSELLLISHGRYCEELKKSVEMILGPQENILTLSLGPNDGPDDFRERFEKIMELSDHFTVFADLIGGTPCNIAARVLMEGTKKFDLYAGMNMPMVISYVNACFVDKKGSLVSDAQNGIACVNEIIEQA